MAESEEKYRTVFENSGTATIIIEEDKIISMVNIQSEKMYGYSKEEIENKMKWTDFVIPEDLEKMKKYHIARRKAGEKAPTEYEFRLIDKKGNTRDIFLKIGMIPGTKKSIASLMDITERKQAEQNVKKAKDELQMIMDSVPAIITYKDTESKIIRANKALANSLKIPVKDIVGKTTEELFPKEQAERMRKDDKEVILSGKPKRNIIQPYTTPEGIRWIITDKIPYKDKEGKVTGLISLSKDITELKQVEEDLRESKTRYKNLYSMMRLMCDNLPDLIWTKDIEGKFLFANKACCEILLDTRDTDEPIGKTDIYFADRLMKSHPEIPDYFTFGKKCVESDLITLKTRKPMRFDESGNMKGKLLFFDVYKAPFYDDKGNITGTVGSARVVTKERKMGKELQQSYQKLKKTMDATIDTMSNITEAKDPYTSGHQHRVCQLAVPLAQELGLPEDKIEGIRIASLIHDIGKIGLPTEILSKPGKLTDIEFSLIKGHSQIGYDILKSIDFSYPIAKIVLQHHENIDGSGYPNGLKDNEISIEAKILRIADTVEAMSSFRPYRPAKGINAALEEISKNKGTLYDPEVVDTCIKLFKEKEFKF